MLGIGFSKFGLGFGVFNARFSFYFPVVFLKSPRSAFQTAGERGVVVRPWSNERPMIQRRSRFVDAKLPND